MINYDVGQLFPQRQSPHNSQIVISHLENSAQNLRFSNLSNTPVHPTPHLKFNSVQNSAGDDSILRPLALQQYKQIPPQNRQLVYQSNQYPQQEKNFNSIHANSNNSSPITKLQFEAMSPPSLISFPIQHQNRQENRPQVTFQPTLRLSQPAQQMNMTFKPNKIEKEAEFVVENELPSNSQWKQDQQSQTEILSHEKIFNGPINQNQKNPFHFIPDRFNKQRINWVKETQYEPLKIRQDQHQLTHAITEYQPLKREQIIKPTIAPQQMVNAYNPEEIEESQDLIQKYKNSEFFDSDPNLQERVSSLRNRNLEHHQQFESERRQPQLVKIDCDCQHSVDRMTIEIRKELQELKLQLQQEKQKPLPNDQLIDQKYQVSKRLKDLKIEELTKLNAALLRELAMKKTENRGRQASSVSQQVPSAQQSQKDINVGPILKPYPKSKQPMKKKTPLFENQQKQKEHNKIIIQQLEPKQSQQYENKELIQPNLQIYDNSQIQSKGISILEPEVKEPFQDFLHHLQQTYKITQSEQNFEPRISDQKIALNQDLSEVSEYTYCIDCQQFILVRKVDIHVKQCPARAKISKNQQKKNNDILDIFCGCSKQQPVTNLYSETYQERMNKINDNLYKAEYLLSFQMKHRKNYTEKDKVVRQYCEFASFIILEIHKEMKNHIHNLVKDLEQIYRIVEKLQNDYQKQIVFLLQKSSELGLEKEQLLGVQ